MHTHNTTHPPLTQQHTQFRDPITAWAMDVNELNQALDAWGVPNPCDITAAAAAATANTAKSGSGDSDSGGKGGASEGGSEKTGRRLLHKHHKDDDEKGKDEKEGKDKGDKKGKGDGKEEGDNSSNSDSSSSVSSSVSEQEGGGACNKLVFMTAVGTMDNCVGGASLYISTDELRCVSFVLLACFVPFPHDLCDSR